MKIISIINDFDIIEQILKHLELWDIRNHDPPEIEPAYIPELTYVEDSDYDNSGSQIPVFDTFWSWYFWNWVEGLQVSYTQIHHILILSVYFYKKYASQPMSIFLSE